MSEEFAAGASAARNKLARRLRDIGIDVVSSSFGCPPKDEDFVEAIAESVGNIGTDERSPQAVVVFKWWQSTYYLVVPASVLDDLQNNPGRQHPLFSAASPGGRNLFYIAAAGDGNAVVHKKKLWRRGDAEQLDTTVLRVRAMQPSPGIVCPVCGAGTNTSGRDFESDWAVACHLAGMIQSGDRAHKAWVDRQHLELTTTSRGYKLAYELYPAVRHELGTG